MLRGGDTAPHKNHGLTIGWSDVRCHREGALSLGSDSDAHARSIARFHRSASAAGRLASELTDSSFKPNAESSAEAIPARSRSSRGGASGRGKDVWCIELLKGEPYPIGVPATPQFPPPAGEGSGALRHQLVTLCNSPANCSGAQSIPVFRSNGMTQSRSSSENANTSRGASNVEVLGYTSATSPSPPIYRWP